MREERQLYEPLLRVTAFVIPVVVFSVLFNLPKFWDTNISYQPLYSAMQSDGNSVKIYALRLYLLNSENSYSSGVVSSQCC